MRGNKCISGVDTPESEREDGDETSVDLGGLIWSAVFCF